jgi:hypothetical protein
MRRLALAFVAVLAGCTPALHAHRIDTAGRASPHARAALAPVTSDEAEILAAYMRARDVDVHAYFDLDPSVLETAYAKFALADRIDEIETRRREGRPMAYRMEYHPRVTKLSATMAFVDDDVRNHSVRLDPVTRQPVEADPDELLQETFTLERLEMGWRVVFFDRVES